MGSTPPEPNGGTRPPFCCNPGFCMSGLWAGPGGHSSFPLSRVWAPLGLAAGGPTRGFSVGLGLPHSMAAGCGEPGVGPAGSSRTFPDLAPGGAGWRTSSVLCWLKKAQAHSVWRGGDLWRSGSATLQKSICHGTVGWLPLENTSLAPTHASEGATLRTQVPLYL